jgi:hypothetical protein
MGKGPDEWLTTLKGGGLIAEVELKHLCDLVRAPYCLAAPRDSNFCVIVQVKDRLIEESNVQPVRSPVTVSR